MSVITLVAGAKGAHGEGMVYLMWRNNRAIESGDSTSVKRYLYRWRNRATAAPTSQTNETFFTAPRDGSLHHLCAKFTSTPPVTVTFEVYVNNVATGMLVSAGNTSAASNASTEITIVKGDKIDCVVSYASGTPTGTNTFPRVAVLIR